MKKIPNLIAYFWIYLISVSPQWLKSILVFKLYLLVYYGVGYRKKTVRSNLILSFPDKSLTELRRIERKFYHHFIQIFMDTISPLSWSEDEINSHYQIENIELLQQYLSQRSVLLIAGHYANWEWVTSIANRIDTNAYVVYQPIHNPFFDQLLLKIRSKYKSELIPSGAVAKQVISNVKKGKRAVYTMVSDQSPMLEFSKFWMPFMGVEVPVHTGAESLAKKGGMAVLYLCTKRIKKGYYSVVFKELSTNAAQESEHEITRAFYKALEAQINETPELYFWTHRRWKHANKR